MYKELFNEFTKLASNLSPSDLNEVSYAFLKEATGIDILPMYDFTSEKNVDLGEYMSGVYDDASSEGYKKGIAAGVAGLIGAKFALGRGKDIVEQLKNKLNPPPAKMTYKDKLSAMVSRMHPKEAEELCASLDKIAAADTYTEVLTSMDKIASFLGKEELDIVAESLMEKEAFLGMMGAGVKGAIKGGKDGMNAKNTVNSFNSMYGTPVFHSGGDLKHFNNVTGTAQSKAWTDMVASGKSRDVQKKYNEANAMSSQSFMQNVKGGWGKGQQMQTNYDMYMKEPGLVPKGTVKDMERYYGRPIGPNGGPGNSGGRPPAGPPPNFAQSHPYMTAAMGVGAGMMLPKMMAYGPQNNNQAQGAPMPMMTPPMMYYR